MHLISATLTGEAFAIRSRWGNRQKSAGISEAIVFYDLHGPSNLKGLWRENEEMRKNIAGLQRRILAAQAEIDRLSF